EDAQNVVRIARDAGRNALAIPADLVDAASCTSAVEQAAQRLGGLDILVNNAGKQVSRDGLAVLPDQQMVETFEANIFAMFRLTRAALEYLPAGSSIINSTSIQAYQ